MKRFQTAAMLAAAAIAFVGCKQENQGGLSQSGNRDEESARSEKQTIDKSARDAKNQIEQQAKAQKDRIDAEAHAAKAQINAEQADIKARTNNAQQAVEASTQKIRDAAGAASSQSPSQSGSQSSGANVNTQPSEPYANGAPPSNSGANASQSSSGSTTDQSLMDLVKKAVGVSADTTSTTGNNVQVTVSNGTVTLSGTVASEEEKSVKEKQARAVPGVKDVRNQLQVKSQ